MTMTYYGTTAVSTSRNPPVLLYSVVGGRILYTGDLGSSGIYPNGGPTNGRGGKVWLYNSTNAPSDLSGAGSIQDGTAIGMAKGDVMLCVFNGGTATTDAYGFLGVLNSTESSLSTGAWNLASNYTT